MLGEEVALCRDEGTAEAQAEWISGVKELRKTEGNPDPWGQKRHPLEKQQESSCHGDGERGQDKMVPDMIDGPMQLTRSTHTWKPAQSMGTSKPSLDQSAANQPVPGPGPL